MTRLNETVRACSIASAVKGCEEPSGSGVYLPDRLFSNVSKLNCAENFWRLMALLGDIAGGITVAMPSERELKNPETSSYVKKYLKAAVSAETRMRMTKFVQNWAAGLHGVATWHGAGSPRARRLEIYRAINLEEKKKLAEKLADIKKQQK
jgi:4-hydroxybutyryl-CoA dehydratase/vinylacetyl-CoA-Delta-isomerase